MMGAESYLKELFLKGLEVCSPENAVAEALVLERRRLKISAKEYDLGDRPIYLFAVGKAAVPMYMAADEVLGERIDRGFLIYPAHGNIPECSADTVIGAAHPTPKNSSLKAGRQAVEFMRGLPENALVVTLISGGTSSLMCLPAGEIAIGDLNTTFELLNSSGATISEINTVRKHCSQIKGGQLLSYLNPSVTVVDLVISDVPGNELAIIGSGPTVADPTTFEDADRVLKEHGLWEKIPDTVSDYILRGIAGKVPETLKRDSEFFKGHDSYVISSANHFAKEIGTIAGEEGLEVYIADEPYNMDVKKVAKMVAGEVSKNRSTASKRLFVFYGESTVSVKGEGKGGRNQELALYGALEIDGWEGLSWLSAGTDGIDGPTDAAGAVVSGKTISLAREKGMNPESFLVNNDSYHFHKRMNTLLKTGPTGNNLMDIVLVLVKGEG
ncbi:glycerate kinase type-2 family protein [Fodinibius saliphilus]|uniref:glycerate kinase type-2 family protein n=1 Tax=Fodinibius saliphilus TaxID=1920650 RepID=UPI001108F0D4|nr:DUF4147 domain-containing protein [Fodinibius saliphilus]